MDVIDGLKAIEGSYLYDRVHVSINVIKRAIDLYGYDLRFSWVTISIEPSCSTYSMRACSRGNPFGIALTSSGVFSLSDGLQFSTLTELQFHSALSHGY